MSYGVILHLLHRDTVYHTAPKQRHCNVPQTKHATKRVVSQKRTAIAATASLKPISTHYPCPRTVLTARGHGSPFFTPVSTSRVRAHGCQKMTPIRGHGRPYTGVQKVHGPWTRVFFDTRVHGHGPWTRVSKLSFLTSVDTGIVCIYRA